ncbi:brachyurin-like [Malaya genurostris]|uniref:brachyurin-like n=1 Tax=Malaya genurostris TaxID=325434 RepID=UPI0026F3F2EE|nr:brachyurin-like [Malaya genurostris]
MKTIVLLVSFVALAVASLDLSKFKKIEELDEFWAQLDPRLQQLREKSIPNHRIINGEEAAPGQFPYQTLTLSFFANGQSGLCGGTLLSNNFVMTAAHCVVFENLATHGTSILGAINRLEEEATQQRIAFGTITVHPNYIASLLRNDIAVIELATPAVFNDYVQPVRLPATSDERTFAGMTGIISGFGRTTDETGSPVSSVLMHTSNPILSNADCQAIWGTIWVGAQNICLSPEGARTTCHGDSGGPLTIVDDDGLTVQVGVTSFVHSNGCVTSFPAGFVRTSHYLTWIGESTDVVLRT